MNWWDGQERRAWLDRQNENIGNALSYYLGPAAEPVNALTQGMAMMLPGADMMDMAQSSRDLMESRGGWDTANALGGLGSTALGMFLGPAAKIANHGAREIAEAMAARGDDARKIWDETGWFQGADGKWRFEIDDNPSSYIPSRLEPRQLSGVEFRQGQLADVLPHSDLYEAYPGLASADAVDYPFRHPEGKFGEYRPASDVLRLPESVTLWRGGARSTGLHEAQHAVQHREGFAQGGNPRSWPEKDLPDNPRYQKWSDNQDQVKWANDYYNSQQYKADRDAQNEYYSSVWEPKLQDFDDPEYDKIWAAATEDLARKFPDMARFDQIAKDFGINEPSRKIAPEDAYRRLAGEVEARNVQKRMDMTADQRRATPPWETEDVPRSDQIVRFR